MSQNNNNHNNLNWIVSYIWGIADDVLRDLYVRGKYRDADREADVWDPS
jgi:type I restriction-modification system DNA methylase subunit